jgi:hypothetical protein
MAGATAITLTTIRSLEMNLGLKRPKSPLYLKPWKAELRISVVKVAVMQQKNTYKSVIRIHEILPSGSTAPK